MKIHPLAKEIVLKDQGDVMITLSKNGRIHNDDVIIKLEKNAIKLPAYYIFERIKKRILGEVNCIINLIVGRNDLNESQQKFGIY